MNIRIGIADDHQLFLKSLSSLIEKMPFFQVVVEAMNGRELINKIKQLEELPDLLLIDVNMPLLDGERTAIEISNIYPGMKMAALSMKDEDTTIVKMLRAGCCAYLLKDIHPDELEKAIHEIFQKGYYNGDRLNVNCRRLILKAKEMDELQISAREKQFLELACSDKTYRLIAHEMSLSERTIDGYREALFEKFNVQSRVGMVLEAIRQGIIVF